MQKRLAVRGCVEVASLQIEEDVRGVEQRRAHALPELLVVLRQEQPVRQHHAGQGHDQRRRKQSPDPARVELSEREPLLPELAQHDRADQVAGDREEDVDADESTSEARHVEVVQNHAEHRDGPQAIDVASVVDDGRHVF